MNFFLLPVSIIGGHEESSPRRMSARLSRCLWRSDHRGRWPCDQNPGRSGASGHAWIPVCEGREVSGPGVFARSRAVSHAAGSAEGSDRRRGVGDHPTGKAFERISWDEALDEITSRFRRNCFRVRQRSHPALLVRRDTWARSTAGPWTGASFIAWALRNWSATSAPRPVRPD